MLGAMQDWPLRLPQLIDHAAREHGSREIVSLQADGSLIRTDWADVRRDAMKMAQRLARLGVGPGDRVATLAMNHARHLVAWYGAVGANAVLHTINPRLFDDQLAFIVAHAEDRVLLYDAAFQPLVDRLKPRWPSVEHYVCFDAGFDDWIAGESAEGDWAPGDERDPAMLCYTSGTTGDPKGVLFEHRSTILHTLMAMGPAALALEPRSVALPIVPMFHANNWGFPWACAMTGAKMVYSAVNDPNALCRLIREEGVTHVAGVPTVWLTMFQHLDATGQDLPAFAHALSGGSVVPRAFVERLMRAGVRLIQAWGMTETSPIATVTYESADWNSLSFDDQVTVKTRQGRPPYGCEVRCVDLADPGVEVPRDGVTAGALQVRGQWVVRRYFKAALDSAGEGQWFDTGDVAVIHPDGMLQLTDRTKDVIKSGGEWISSAELENVAIGHPGVAEAAVIGIPHPKWDERPILVAVRKPGEAVSGEDLRAFMADKVAKWWLPDAVEFVDEIPHTGTGKISKKDLRERFRDYRL